MKRKVKSIVVLASVLVVTLLTNAIGFAAEETMQPLTVVGGRVSDERINEAIEEYLYLKTMETSELSVMLSTDTAMLTANGIDIGTLETDAMNRNEGFQALELRLGVEFGEVEIASFVDEIVSQNGNSLVLDVYEETVIEYCAIDGSNETDIMGYGTDHLLTIELIDGEYVVVADSFDERFITGVCSIDVDQSSAVTELMTLDVSVQENIVMPATTDSSFDVTAAVNYANQWCGIAAAKDFTTGGISEDYSIERYNPVYPNYGSSDCANFVSQCLVAGGWTPVGDWQIGGPAWKGAKALHLYLDGLGYATVPAANYNVFPGNPVYWWNADGADSTGHQMICTGYNSAGVPVLNGHSYNMFRVPMTNFLNRGEEGLYTAQIVDSNRHEHLGGGGTYVITTATHGEFCKVCRNGYNHTAHTVVAGVCSVCGYTGPFSGILNIYTEELK